MRRSFFSILLLGLALAFTVSACASTITINTTTGTWTAVNPSNVSNLNGVGTATIHWGYTYGGPQSGLNFTGAQPPSLGINPGDVFDLGTLTHYNNTITGVFATSADLSVLLQTSAGNQTFGFHFGIDETPNITPCAYPSVTPCADAIYLPTGGFSTSTITIAGIDYHLQILGFGSSSSSIESMFISQEGGTNTANLWATLTQNPVTTTPEPASLVLLGTGVLGLFGKRKKMRR